MRSARFRLSELSSGPLARATLETSVVLFLRLLVQAAFLLMLTRLLGAEMFGVFSGVAALAVLLGTLASAGTHLALLGEISVAPDKRDAVLRYALPLSLASSTLLLVVYAALALPLLRETGLSADIALSIGFGEIVFQPFILIAATETLARDRTAHSQLLMTLPLFFKLCAVFLVFVFVSETRLRIFAWAYPVSFFLAFLAVKQCVPGEWPSWRTWRRPSLAELKHTLGYAALNFTATAPFEADKTLALRLLPPQTAGIYATGTRIVGALVLPVTAMLLAALPRFYRQYADASSGKKKLWAWIFGVTLVYGIVIALVLVIAAPLFALLFDASYIRLTETLRFLAFTAPAICLQMSAANILMGQNRPWTRATLEFSGLLVLPTAAFGANFISNEAKMPFALGCAEWWLAAAGWTLVYASGKKTGDTA